MVKAISKFMEDIEKEECTGYNALHKLLQGLPVPEQKNTSSMTQAEEIQGDFLRDLDEEEKKRFTPSEHRFHGFNRKNSLQLEYIQVHTLFMRVRTRTYWYIL